MRRMLLVCLCAVALCSCVGVDSRLTIRNDGSGTLTLDYRIARQAADFGRVSDESVRVPLPVEKADFLRAIDAAPGVRLTRYRRRSDEEQVVIHAVLAFRRLEDLAGIPALRDAGLAFSATGSTRTLTQVVAGSPDAPATPESLAMIDSIFAGAAITVILSTPSPMTPGGVGTLSPDRRTLTWSATLGELARRTGSVVLSATW